MIHHPAESTVYALVDGELDAREASRVEAHVAACEACAALIARAERLKRSVAAAPRSMDPPPEVLAGVRAGIAACAPAIAAASGTNAWSAAPPGAPGRSRALSGGWIAAAGLMAISLGVASFAVGRGSQQGESQPAAPGEAVIASGSTVLGKLLRELETRRPLLAPQTIPIVEEQLRLIDQAIAATEGALRTDPTNQHLERMLQHARRQREDYLRTTLSLAAAL